MKPFPVLPLMLLPLNAVKFLLVHSGAHSCTTWRLTSPAGSRFIASIPYSLPGRSTSATERKTMNRLIGSVMVLLAAAQLQAGRSCLPDPPTNVRVEITDAGVVVSWEDRTHKEVGYRVETGTFGVESWGPWVLVAEVPRNATSVVDRVIRAGIPDPRYYKVTAFNKHGESGVIVGMLPTDPPLTDTAQP